VKAGNLSKRPALICYTFAAHIQVSMRRLYCFNFRL